MATPVVCTGFEYGVLSTSGTGLFNGSSGNPSIDGSNQRSGDYCLKIVASAAASYVNWSLSSPSYLVGRFYIKFPNVPASVRWAQILCGAYTVYFETDASKQMKISVGGVQSQTRSGALSNDTWYMVEFRADTDQNPMVIEWRVDGVAQTTLSATYPGSAPSAFYCGVSIGYTYTAYWDDVLLSETYADYPIGEGQVIGIRPVADGTHNNPSAYLKDDNGNTINATYPAYPWLDEKPWTTAGLTDKIYQTNNGADHYAEVTLAQLSDVGTVNGVMAYCGYCAAAVQTCKAGTEVVDEDSTETAIWGKYGATEAYTPVGSGTLFKRAVLPTPAGGWDQSAVNALKVRFGYSDDANPDPYLCAAMVEVDYVISTAETYYEATTLTRNAGISQASTLTLPGATTLARYAGIGQVSTLTLPGVLTLARDAGMSQAVLSTYEGKTTLARAAGIAQTMIATYADGMTLARTAGIAQTMLATYAGVMTLARTAGIAQGAGGSVYGVGTSFARSAGITHSGGLALFSAVALARSAGESYQPGLSYNVDLTMARDAGDSYAGDYILAAALSLSRYAGDAYDPLLNYIVGLTLDRWAGIAASVLATYDGKFTLGKALAQAQSYLLDIAAALTLARSAGDSYLSGLTYDKAVTLAKDLGITTAAAFDLLGSVALARTAGVAQDGGLSYVVACAFARSAGVNTLSELIYGGQVTLSRSLGYSTTLPTADMYVTYAVSGERFYALSPYDSYYLTSPVVSGDRVKFWVDTRARHNGTGPHNLREPSYGWLAGGSWDWSSGQYAEIIDHSFTEKSKYWGLVECSGMGTSVIKVTIKFNTWPAPMGTAIIYLNIPVYPGSEIWLPDKPAGSTYGLVLDYAAMRNGHGPYDYIDFGDTVTAMTITPSGVSSLGYELTNDDTAAIVLLSGGTAGTVAHVLTKATCYSGQTKTVAVRMKIT